MQLRSLECPFPMGSIYITTDPMNPSGIRPKTYWMPFGKGKALVCVDDEETNQNLQRLKDPEQTGGTKTHQHAITQGSVGAPCESGSMTGDTTNTTQQQFSYQPSITCYIRKRVSEYDVTSYNPFNITGKTPRELYGDNVIVDSNTGEAKQPNPYSIN